MQRTCGLTLLLGLEKEPPEISSIAASPSRRYTSETGRLPSERAVAVGVVGRLGQDGGELGGGVDVRGRNLDTADQSGVLIRRDMRLIAVQRLAATMSCPARLSVTSDARRQDQGGIDQRRMCYPQDIAPCAEPIGTEPWVG
jgi:hypothetical protein